MTRESVPRFDLYEELGVSRLAGREAIEAAYRDLAKQHHPDVSSSADVERIKRLNLARHWLRNPVLRGRYDAATNPPAESASESPSPFGVNALELRQYLAELRSLDWDRALRVWEGRDAAKAKGYARAGRAASAIGYQRREQWLFAREAASVIARGKLGDSKVADEIVEILADAAGAIAIRDLLQAKDFELLLLPWVSRVAPATSGSRIALGQAETTAGPPPAGLPPAMPSSAGGEAAPMPRAVTIEGPITAKAAKPVGQRRRHSRRLGAAVAGAFVLVAVGLGFAAQKGPTANVGIVDATDGHQSSSGVSPSLTTALGEPSLVVTPGAEASQSALTPGPSVTTGGPATARPVLTPTPAPPATPGPTPKPTSSPLPTAVPTPTGPMCNVISLIGKKTNQAPVLWTTAGFSGTVVFNPVVPPQYTIVAQSLLPGTTVPCSSGITVRNQP